MADLGAEVTTGTELYTVDGEPVVTVVADTPSWRTLKQGVADGEDVRTLERALTTLGYGKHLTVDKHFTTATANAVKKWEKALHRQDPDGAVEATDLVIVAQDSQVVDQALTVGDSVPDGSQVLTLASREHVITASVAANDITAWGKDATVTVRWANGETFTGRVSAVSQDIINTADDVTDATADVTIVPTKGTIQQHTGTSADVELVTERIADAVTVPVSALHDGPGGTPAVTVVKAGVAIERSVTLGLVTQGWAQVSGLEAGESVRLPGSSSAGSEDA
jgi:peptidoglycan hydrolase-like protein with peptidoglycan-binding domain